MAYSRFALIAGLCATASLLSLTACDEDALYTEQRASEDIYDAYLECDEGEIRLLASKQNLQTAFENCGSNNFSNFAWAPDGVQLYFQLPMSAHILNGIEKTIGTMPTELPIGPAVWLAYDLLVIPVGPKKDSTVEHLILFDRVQASMQELPLTVKAPLDLMATGTRDQVIFTALDEQGVRRPYLANFTTRTIERTFLWLTEPANYFTYVHEQDLVAWGADVKVKNPDGAQPDPRSFHVTLAKASDGTVLGRYEDAYRAVMHPSGRYLALESLGEPITPFDQRSWDELSPEAREREERRTKAWLDRQPEWVPRSIRPPVIDIVDTASQKRVRLSGLYGERFQWYTAKDYYCSFVFWGAEGKQLNQNVALTDLFERMRMVETGEVPYGVELWRPIDERSAAPAGGAAAAPEAAPATTPAVEGAPAADAAPGAVLAPTPAPQ